MPNLSIDATPGSALFNCIGAMFNYLSTPEGQEVSRDIRTGARTAVTDLVHLVHKSSGAAQAAATDSATVSGVAVQPVSLTDTGKSTIAVSKPAPIVG